MTQALRRSTRRTEYCALGSVKTNLGHLHVASGVLSFIKAALAVHHGLIPPSLHFSAPSPEIPFAETPFFVNTRACPWPDGPRRAGVSAFGFAGANVHVVLEQAPRQPRPRSAPSPELLVLSAKTAPALAQPTTDLRRFLTAHPEVALADAAYTLQVGRKAHAHRQTCSTRPATRTSRRTPTAC